MTKANQKQKEKENGKRKAPAPDGLGGVLYVAVCMWVVVFVDGKKIFFTLRVKSVCLRK